MAAEAFGDRFVDVFDLAVEIEQLTRQPLDQLGGTGLSGQRDVLLVGQCHCGGRGLGQYTCPTDGPQPDAGGHGF